MRSIVQGATLLFVYGTMKSPCRNWNRLYHANALKIGNQFHTNDRFDMFLGASVSAPYAVRNEAGSPILGELYAINEDQLPLIDSFEGHPTVYRREPVALQGFNDRCRDDLIVEMYVFVGELLPSDRSILAINGVLDYDPWS